MNLVSKNNLCTLLRVSVSSEPDLDDSWEVVLEDSFEKQGQEVSADILEFPLSSSVTDKRFIKFEIISFGDGAQGCIQFFDVVRKATNERSGIILFIII